MQQGNARVSGAWRRIALGARSAVSSLILALAAAAGAQASVIDQAWLGVYAHDVSDLGAGKESNTEDIQLEAQTVQPQALRFLGAPHIVGTLALNTAGETNFGALSLGWDHRLVGPLYASLQFGIGLSDGVDEPAAGAAGDEERRRRLILGSKALFREAVGVDWRFSRRWAAGVEYVHASNGQILGHGVNEGINDVGLRLGYHFN